MSSRLTPGQIRGARGMLDWSMVDLAKAAGVSVSTVKRAEDATSQIVSNDVCGRIQTALENAGVQFLHQGAEGAGVRLRSAEFQG